MLDIDGERVAEFTRPVAKDRTARAAGHRRARGRQAFQQYTLRYLQIALGVARVEARRCLGVRRATPAGADWDEPARSDQAQRQRGARVLRRLVRVVPPASPDRGWRTTQRSTGTCGRRPMSRATTSSISTSGRGRTPTRRSTPNPLDATGSVPWWPEDRRNVTLHRLLVHVIAETNRHAGHADIVRELIDGAAGLRADNSNLGVDRSGVLGSTPGACRTGGAARRRRPTAAESPRPEGRTGAPCDASWHVSPNRSHRTSVMAGKRRSAPGRADVIKE